MNKKIFLVAILSVLLLTISVVAVNENAKREIAPEDKTPVQPGGKELSSPAFHEMQFTSSTALIGMNAGQTSLLTQFVSCPVTCEFTATFSAETNTGSANTLSIRVLDNGVTVPPGAVFLIKILKKMDGRRIALLSGKLLPRESII
ncbi:hypothetical protein [Candidatus Methanoperedens nitratireducens]|uniref:Uncharacterized protein n=1 Tax=Candidatus Methanoperedens nitratireducens TaxID=1392998 RepID=A0A284VKP7_9EURY|nr:hypothetical protein [Candidatus Methanoperedens nitroreducens]SNQ59838.1 exported hypothetical protein [Candidatus Methanoperedens nitroreducens]